MLFEICFESGGILWANDDYLGPPLNKFRILLAQLRHMPLAEWSGEGPVEYQQHIGFSAEIGKPEWSAFEIYQGKVWSRGIKADL
jgi:hypothetical protein